MRTTSADGKKDAITGIFVLIGVSLLAYFTMTNISWVLDNGILIILAVIIFTIILTLIPYVTNMIADNIVNEEPEVEKSPEQNKQTISEEELMIKDNNS